MFCSHLNMILDICIVGAATQAVAAHEVKETFQFLLPTCATPINILTALQVQGFSMGSPTTQGAAGITAGSLPGTRLLCRT